VCGKLFRIHLQGHNNNMSVIMNAHKELTSEERKEEIRFSVHVLLKVECMKEG